jgi:aspartate ammonia-lyase
MRTEAESKPMPARLVIGERTGQEPASLLHTASMETRREHDLLGELDVPASAYWGIHSQRAVANFPITLPGYQR